MGTIPLSQPTARSRRICLRFPPYPEEVSFSSQLLKLHICPGMWAPPPSRRSEGLADCLWPLLHSEVVHCRALSNQNKQATTRYLWFETEWLNWRTFVCISNTKNNCTPFRNDLKLLRHTFHAAQFSDLQDYPYHDQFLEDSHYPRLPKHKSQMLSLPVCLIGSLTAAHPLRLFAYSAFFI